MRFTEEQCERGVRERRFELGEVPGILWTAETGDPGALLCIGHGGTRHKRVEYVLSLARRVVRHQGWAAVAIDAPGHGERAQGDVRRVFDLSPEERAERVRTAIADWTATLDAVHAEIGAVRTGWWGLSMGTSLGLPFVAGEPRIEAAVLGLMGIGQPWTQRLVEDAPKITIPVLFLVQWDDELVPRDDAMRLFDALGATDKTLHAHPGLHVQVPAEEYDHSEAFLARHLAGARV